MNENTVNVTKTAADQAAKIQALMTEGKTLEEALTIVGTKAPRQPIDRVAYIKGLSNLTDLRKARKTAFAKKSKSKDNPDATARYQLEIEAASARLNEILAEVNAAESPWEKALEYGDTPDGALQYFITSQEIIVGAFFDKLEATKAQVKAMVQKTKPNTAFVPAQLTEPFTRRIENRDQRLYTLAARYQLMEDLKDGTQKVPVADAASDTKAPAEKPAKGKGKSKKGEAEAAAE